MCMPRDGGLPESEDILRHSMTRFNPSATRKIRHSEHDLNRPQFLKCPALLNRGLDLPFLLVQESNVLSCFSEQCLDVGKVQAVIHVVMVAESNGLNADVDEA